MTGIALIITFIVAVVLMIVAISKFKVHPFLAIMGIALALGMVVGIPLEDLPGTIGSGFSGIFTSIGIVIILGALIGIILEKTGAAVKLADMVIKVVGEKRPEIAILIMGWIVSIPVFCDSGFVILDPIRKAMRKRTMTSSVAMTVSLSAGLYASHVFIPPTPGPIAAAGAVLGKVITTAGFVDYIKDNANFLSSVGIFFPFLIAAILKSAQGSSTVAITTTAGIMGSFMESGTMMQALGLTTPIAAALTVMAIGAGAMTVSHANDSYFWVVTNFGKMKPQDGYKTQTMVTLIMGIVAMITIFIISLFVL